MTKCPKCNGSGKIYAELPKKSANAPDVEVCPKCGGSGEEQNDVLDAQRYRWIRDRFQIRYERGLSGGKYRAILTARIPFGFLDSQKNPADGWTDLKYFNECRNEVDTEIDKAMGK
jgi:hypothetical protein